MHEIRLWEPCINKKFNSDIFIRIFSYCDPTLRNVCKLWNSIILKNNYLWWTWYRHKWVNKIQDKTYLQNYYKMSNLDYKWFNDLYKKIIFYENSWILDSKMDNDKIITASKWGIIKLWKTNDLLNSFVKPFVYSGHLGPINSLDFNEKIIVSGSQDGTIRIWEYDDHNYKTMLTHHTDEICFVKIYKNKIYSGSRDKTVKIYDLETREIKTLLGHTNSVWTIDFDEDDNIYTGSLDGTFKFWDNQSLECKRTELVNRFCVLKILYHNGYLFIGSWNGTIEIWKDFKKIYSLSVNNTFISSLKIINDKLITSGYDDNIKIYKIVYYPKIVLRLKNIIEGTKITSVSATNNKLLATNSSGQIIFYNFDI